MKVLIATDHAILGQGMADFLVREQSLNIRAIVCPTSKARAIAAKERPGVILLDMHSLSIDGPGLVASLQSMARPSALILLLSGTESQAYIQYLLDKNIIGLLSRQVSLTELRACIVEARNRRVYMPKGLDVAGADSLLFSEKMDIFMLSRREVEIANLVSAGMTSKEVAALTGLSRKTVDIHRHNILKKLKLTTELNLLICSPRLKHRLPAEHRLRSAVSVEACPYRQGP